MKWKNIHFMSGEATNEIHTFSLYEMIINLNILSIFSHTNAYKIESSLCLLTVGKTDRTSLPKWDKLAIFGISYMTFQIEPRHDKTNKMAVRPAKTQISLGIRPVWSESSLSAWRKLGPLATHWAHSDDSNQTERMPRLSLRWVHTRFVGFVMSWLNYLIF